MKQTFALLIVSAILSLALVPGASAHTDPFAVSDDMVLWLAQGQNKLSKKQAESQAAKRAQRQHGGEVVKVVCRDQDNRYYCSVRLNIDGRIKTVTIRL